MENKILYLTSEVIKDSSLLKVQVKYPQICRNGIGIYFSDNIENMIFFSKQKNKKGKIIQVNSIFSFIVTEVFYDSSKLKKIENNSLSILEFDHNPSYSELNLDSKDKMVEPNGIHYINKENLIDKKDFIGNEYVITEKDQFFPFYTITIKRNEYFVLHRDLNFKGKNEYSKFLKEIKNNDYFFKMNIYYESSTEEALKFLLKRRYNKVILVTNIGLDYSGRRFVEIARKILGFDIIVLFLSNNKKHLEWIKDFPNCLYTNKDERYKEYIINYTENGLKKLKERLEEENLIKFKSFSFDFMTYPNAKDKGDFSSLDFKCEYLRNVYIKNKDKYLCMNKERKVLISDDEQGYAWDITLLGNEITLFSNGFYLYINEDKENVIGDKYMKIWNLEINNGYFAFINKDKEKNNILSIDGEEIKVNKENIGENEKFELIDTNKENINESLISNYIKNETISAVLSDSN